MIIIYIPELKLAADEGELLQGCRNSNKYWFAFYTHVTLIPAFGAELGKKQDIMIYGKIYIADILNSI